MSDERSIIKWFYIMMGVAVVAAFITLGWMDATEKEYQAEIRRVELEHKRWMVDNGYKDYECDTCKESK